MRYRSTFLDSNGKRGIAVIDASDEQELHESLHREGRVLLQVQMVRARTTAARHKRLKPRQLLLFVQSLESSLDAGVPLLAALSALAEQEPDARIRILYDGLLDRVARGTSLSEAMQDYPRSFGPVIVALVRAGESSGNLPRVFAALGEYLEWRMELGASVRQAMVYPAVVLTAGYGLVLFLLSFVLPRLSSVLSKLSDGHLPTASMLLVSLSTWVSENLLLVLAGSALTGLGLVLTARSQSGGRLFAGALARMPVARDLVRTLNIAQLCRNLSVLLEAGLTIVDTLELTGPTLSLRRLQHAVRNAKTRIVEGAKVTEAFSVSQLLPPVALGMVRVGEDSGTLPRAFARLSTMYDRQVKHAVKKTLAMLEPLVTVVLGVIVGGVAALVLTTIYSAMQGIGR